MTNRCEKWKDQLLEAALTGAVAKELADHLRDCKDCAAEIRELEARKARLDALLPLVAQSPQPSADFRARVLAAAAATDEHKRVHHWRIWTLAGAATAVVVMLTVGLVRYRETTRRIQVTEVEGAQRLAEWRAPTDTLLATPGQEILRTTPKLGESYLNVPLNKKGEEE